VERGLGRSILYAVAARDRVTNADGILATTATDVFDA
jgi:hypothetical protein